MTVHRLDVARAGRDTPALGERENSYATGERTPSMRFMVVERFREQDAKAVYRRLHREGRLMPDGLAYEGSWVGADLDRCFQLVECEDVSLLQQWVANWQDLIEFEIVPVVDGDETAAAIEGLLE